MPGNKARDDKFINKDQKHEIDFILDQYGPKDQSEVKKAIEKGNYQSHDELYKKLARKGIKKKS
jgi:hypothetical protein